MNDLSLDEKLHITLWDGCAFWRILLQKKSSQGFCRKKIVSRLHVGVLIWYADVFLKRRKTKLWNRLFFESRCSWLWGNDVRSEMLETKKRFNPFLFILILKPWHWNPFVSSNKTHQKLRKTSSPQNGVFFFLLVRFLTGQRVGQQSQTGRTQTQTSARELRFEWWYLGSITNSCKSTKGQVQSLGCWSYDGQWSY